MNFFDLAFHLRVAGVLLLALALFHGVLPGRFGWREELQHISLLSRQIFYVHTFFIALTVGLMGALSLVCARELATPSPLARGVLCGLTAFWLCRLAFQFFIYDTSLWRGQPFETRVHWLFAALWLYLAMVFGWALRQQF
jgi:hypothetical protein